MQRRRRDEAPLSPPRPPSAPYHPRPAALYPPPRRPPTPPAPWQVPTVLQQLRAAEGAGVDSIRDALQKAAVLGAQLPDSRLPRAMLKAEGRLLALQVSPR